MNDLMKSVSGIRGIFGKGINPENVMRFAAHFGLFQRKQNQPIILIERRKFPTQPLPPGVPERRNNPQFQKKIKIVVGRDTRTTGEALANAAIAGLLSVGVDVVWLGIVSTPTLLLSVKELEAHGGICITASHNPGEWNALKFIDSNGMFLYPEVMIEFLKIIENEVIYTSYQTMGKLNNDWQASERHIKKILSIKYLDLPKIRSKRFKVVLDSINGAGCMISASLLKELGCEVIEINSEPNGLFTHPPEPLSHNLSQICVAVKDHKADIGFATDPDVDRLAIINEKGECIGEEYSLLLAEKFILSHVRGNIVTNLSSSTASEDIAREFNVMVIRTPIGEINVGKKMKEIKSPVGGEGNGGIICPEVNYTRDALAGMALILGYMAQSDMLISDLATKIPKYYIAKDKIEIQDEDMDSFFSKVERLFPKASIDKTDGVKFILNKSWIHIRKSGTEPIIRVYAEADSQEKADKLCEEVIKGTLSGARV